MRENGTAGLACAYAASSWAEGKGHGAEYNPPGFLTDFLFDLEPASAKIKKSADFCGSRER